MRTKNKVAPAPKAGKRQTHEVVLGGGANRGFAHCGLLKAIETLGILVGTVTGVSIGSIIAAFYCNGYTPDEILHIFYEELSSLSKPKLIRSLLIPGSVSRLFGGNSGGGLVDLPAFFSYLIEKYDLKPQPNLRIIAYNVMRRKPVIFEGTDYDLLTAVCASCAVPFLMRPVWFGQKDLFGKIGSLLSSMMGMSYEGLLVDGGVHHPCPGDFCEGTAIIGKLGFATALPSRLLSPSDFVMHMLEMLAAPLLGWYFRDPEGHVVIDIGVSDVACMSFGLPFETCDKMASHAFDVSLKELTSAIKAGVITAK